MPSALDIIDHSPHHPEAAAPIATASNVVLIDNYDSFTWNVYQYLVLEGATVTVFRNDKVQLDELIAMKPTQLVVSPGPGHPSTDSGVSRAAIEHFAGKIPVFGVCMGQQCIFDVYGGTVDSAGEILHGKTSPLAHDGRGVYAGLAQNLPVTRYHSLAGTYGSLPPSLEVTSWISKPDGSRGVIMGVRHKEYTVEGVQFHPESILSAEGRAMVRNFLLMRGGTWAENKELQAAGNAADVAAGKAKGAAKPSGNILQQIYARRRELVGAQMQVPSQRMADLQAAYDYGAAPPALSLVDRLRQSPFPVALMAEIKRASPSKGVFALDIRAPVQAQAYAQAGASVISVLTEPDWFKGSIEDLRAVRQVLQAMPNRPAILRKEFIFDEYQILEARLAGADTVLLIVKMLDDATLARLYRYSQSLGMEPLVEVQNAAEMARAVGELGAKVIGVNNRNLESFEVDLKTTSRLRSMVPADTILCALSGINTRTDVIANEQDGVNAVLVGEAIMRAANPAQFIQQLCSGAPLPSSSSSSSPLSRTQPLLVKICGTRSVEAALEAARSGADMVGVILVPGTKRFVADETALAISKAVHGYAEEEADKAAASITTSTANTATSGPADFFSLARDTLSRQRKRRPLLVGVFQNQPLDYVLAKQRLYDLDVVQLHGREPVEWARLLPVPVVHKFAPGEPGVSQRGYHVTTLLDSGSGSGAQLAVSAVLAELQRDPALTFLIAGGLMPSNLADVLTALGSSGSAHVLGVDTSSGVETDGKQDLAKIRAFVHAAKQFRQ